MECSTTIILYSLEPQLQEMKEHIRFVTLHRRVKNMTPITDGTVKFVVTKSGGYYREL